MKKKPSSSDNRKSTPSTRQDDENDEATNNNNNNNENNDNEDELNTPPSFDSSIGSESTSSRFRNDGRPGGRGGGNNGGCRPLYDDHDGGKIRPASSRDTISTTSLSHFDGNSSTGTLSHGPSRFGTNQNQHQHPRRRRPLPSSSRLFNRQLLILSSSAGTSLVFFLFFFLGTFAFTALMSFVVSTFMLIYTSYAYIIHLIQIGELNIFTLLPESVRDRLMNSSIHEMFTDDTGYMENRFLLLYFIPGLTPEQILQMVNRLPERHRDLVLGPGGLARIFFPSVPMPNRSNNNNVIVSGDNSGMDDNAIQLRNNGNTSIDQQHLPLPVIEEGDEEPLPPIEEQEITNSDALRGIFDTARTLFTGQNPNQYDDQVEQDLDDELHLPQSQDSHQFVPDLSWDNLESHEEENHIEVELQSQASDESDLGLDINPDDMTGNLQEHHLGRIARVIGIRHNEQQQQQQEQQEPQQHNNTDLPPRTVTARPINTRPQHPQQQNPPSALQESTEEERNLENEIINDAVSTVINNYYNTAARSITEVTANIIDGIAPMVIRAGARISSLSGVGLLGIFSSRMLNEYPVSVMGRSITSRNLSEGRAGRYAIRGLLSTLTMGVVTVGTAYLTRAYVRRQRDSFLTSNEDDKEKSEEDDKANFSRDEDGQRK